MSCNNSLIAFNQTGTHLVHYNTLKNRLRFVSLLDDKITSFQMNASNIQQVEPYYNSDILFIRSSTGLTVWNVTRNAIVGEYPLLNVRQMHVSKKYIVLCTNSKILLLYASTLSLFQEFPIVSSNFPNSCAIDHYNNRTVFAYSVHQGTCSICRENTVATISVSRMHIINTYLHCAHDTLIIVTQTTIFLYRLSSLHLRRKTENKLGCVHITSLSKNMCYCSNKAGKTQCISLFENRSDIFIDHKEGVYKYSHGALCNISNGGIVLRRIRVE